MRFCVYLQPWYGYSESTRSEEGTVNSDQAGADTTHIKDNKDSVELGTPSGNRLLVVLRVKESRDCIASALADDLVLYFRNSSAIESVMGIRTTILLVQLTSSIDLSHRAPTD